VGSIRYEIKMRGHETVPLKSGIPDDEQATNRAWLCLV